MLSYFDYLMDALVLNGRLPISLKEKLYHFPSNELPMVGALFHAIIGFLESLRRKGKMNR